MFTHELLVTVFYDFYVHIYTYLSCSYTRPGLVLTCYAT